MQGGSPRTLRPFPWRARLLYAETEVVSRTREGIVRYDSDSDGDRAKDVIESGGEWISSRVLENELLGHDAVAEAASPTSAGRNGRSRWSWPAGDDLGSLSEELRGHILAAYPKWWVPDDVVTVDEIPKTATGTFDKKALRDEHADESLVEGCVPDAAAPE